jgi:hypothetical protein
MNDIAPIVYPKPYVAPEPAISDLRCWACKKSIEVQGLIMHLAFNPQCSDMYGLVREVRHKLYLKQQNWGYWIVPTLD